MLHRQMAETEEALTLGGVHRSLRGEIGSSGASMVAIAFEQHTTLSPTHDAEYNASVFSRRYFRAALDFEEADLVRADLRAGSMADDLSKGFQLRHQDSQYVYSVDGVHFGLFEGDPYLFDLREFETMLDNIKVNNLTVEQARAKDEQVTVDSFDVEIESEGFVSLVRIFGDSVTATEEHSLDTFTVHFAAGGDLLLDYWWKTRGEEPADEPGAPPYDCYISCHVTIRLASIASVVSQPVTLDPEVPTAVDVDTIWASMRDSA
jgi:hypothetical protein